MQLASRRASALARASPTPLLRRPGSGSSTTSRPTTAPPSSPSPTLATLVARAAGGDGGDQGAGADPNQKGEAGKSFEDLFQQELKRRGIDEAAAAGKPSSSSPRAAPANQGPRAPAANPFASSSASSRPRDETRARSPAGGADGAADAGELGGQRERSMRLVSEGLDGLLPRAKQLVLLGGSVFLGFLPAMLIFSLVFTGVFSVFGESFVHGGRTGALPQYMDPEELLAAPTVDRFVPFRPDPDL